MEDNNGRDKRRRIDELRSQTQSKAKTSLTYADYTVGWICALHLEMTAAVAMLDEEHESLPSRTGDDNVYTLGSMSGHNVVIASLPTGVYGTTSATAVGLAMRLTYPNSIILPLMVGIGGGVPSPSHDIRLGDVVVGIPTSEGPAVKQYDYGKTTSSSGLLEVKGQLNKPAPILLSAVAKLRTVHELRPPGQHTVHISEALERFNLAEYTYPGIGLDNLLEAECEHSLESDVCGVSCCQKTVVRKPRLNSNPAIHYGTIGSGNQVMKHGQMRDRIAKSLGIICFEMEAAGLMDYLPCLVIRGICDYCDSGKRKEFQGYAALSGAAYAKELLSMIPAREALRQLNNSVPAKSIDEKHRKTVMNGLKFKQAESRRATVKKAHKQTCRWFAEQQQFVDWLDVEKTGRRNGLLWIKGKPGIGKSTLMKYILEKEEQSKSGDRITISFFFNARGHQLEKSILGMYRSLIHQLLRQIARLQVLLDDFDSNIVFDQDQVGVLENLFRDAVRELGSKQLLCFIDALDECPEDQIRDMVHVFEELGEACISNKISFLILFSSRHYPNISIKRGTVMILEEQDGHSHDLVKYINAELRIGKTKQAEQIKQDVFEKSRGIFLWVFLTVRILQTEYDKGRLHSLKNRLKDIPLELNDLFRDILTRDKQRLPELVLCIQWILYAKRPLLREEFYLALLAGDESVDTRIWDEESTPFVMDNFILDCSKGLAELTRGNEPTVQFIHESVREFLLQPYALAGLWPGFQGISGGLSHQQLRDCCTRYITLSDLTELNIPQKLEPDESKKTTKLRKKLRILHPFLEYATQYVFFHADSAEQSQLSQADFLRSFCLSQWRHIYNILQTYATRRFQEHQDLACILATLDVRHLLLVWLPFMQSFDKDLEALFAALIAVQKPDLCKKVVAWHRGQVLNTEDISLEYVEVFFELLSYEKLSSDRHAAAIVGKILLHWPLNINIQVKAGITALSIAAESGNKRAVQILLEYGADVNGQRGHYGSPLEAACHPGYEQIARMLVEAGADVNAQGGYYGSPLQAACYRGYEQIARILIENKADVSAQGGFHGNALQAACYNGHEQIARMLVEAGADLNAQGGYYGSALQAACYRGDKQIARMLVEAGANFDVDALHGFDMNGHDSTIKMLIEARIVSNTKIDAILN